MNQELLFWRVLLTLPLLSQALDLEKAFEEGKFQSINIEGYHLNIFKKNFHCFSISQKKSSSDNCILVVMMHRSVCIMT